MCFLFCCFFGDGYLMPFYLDISENVYTQKQLLYTNIYLFSFSIVFPLYCSPSYTTFFIFHNTNFRRWEETPSYFTSSTCYYCNERLLRNERIWRKKWNISLVYEILTIIYRYIDKSRFCVKILSHFYLLSIT